MQTRLTWIAVAATLAVLAAGCGGSSRMSKAAYQAKIQADGQSVQDAIDKITSNPGALTQLALQVAAAEAAAKKAADDLDAAKPPQDVAADNATLVSALRTIDTQLKKLAQAAKAGDLLAAQAAASAIRSSPEVVAARAAVLDMRKKGYTVGVFGS